MEKPLASTVRETNISPSRSHSVEEPEFSSELTNRPPEWWKVFQELDVRWGLLWVGLSALLFAGYDYYVLRHEDQHSFLVFMIHYAIAIAYTIDLLKEKKLRFLGEQPPEGRSARMAALVLWLLSAYALNRNLPVFQESVPWLQGLLVLSGLLMLGVAWLDKLPVRGQQGLVFGLAVVWGLFFYQALYLFLYYFFGVPGILLLGIGVHAFIPLLIAVTIGRILWRSWIQHEHRQPAVVAGLLVPVFVLVWFLYQWTQVDTQVRYESNAANARKDDEFPVWLLLAQRLPDNWVTDRYLKAGTKYSQAGDQAGSLFGAKVEYQRHDPLVYIATAYQRPVTAGNSDMDKAKIVRTKYGFRHQTEERLWRGTALRTTNVLTQARIYPEYRLAYTEKTLQVQNGDRWSPQEALYTFHVPEGAVVTSLSLWINGREEKGRLTTKARANAAYRTIVGVESRDPAVVHWHEGNRVTVRVFPCPPNGTRQFKIGITSPLRLENRLDGPAQLVYENSWFEGPDGQIATETVKLNFSQKPHHPVWPDFLKPGWLDKPVEHEIISESTYQPLWEFRFDAPPLAPNGFRFGSNTYALQSVRQQTEVFNPTAIFLDLNQNWSENETDAVLKMVGTRPVWVYDEGLVRLTPQNRKELTERLRQQRFSVFPFYRIPNRASALLVTKGAEMGPYLNDLAGSAYEKGLKHDPVNQPALRTFCLSKPSELVKTLSELGIFQTDYGTLRELQGLLTKNRFFRQTHGDDTVVLPQSGVRIVRTPNAKNTVSIANIPDHVFRLYAYTHLLKQIGRSYLADNYTQDSFLADAQQANIVSPVSSLIVLETQEDYDRFGIRKSRDGLENATLKNTGAVPEPHEWALLLLLLGWGIYNWWKKRHVGV
ncbi:XrtN system VIT domain-containing protein [Larkinella harenae]